MAKRRSRPIITSDAGKSPAHLPTVFNRDILLVLWKRAIRGNRQAQEKLASLVQGHPGLETILKAFSGDRDAVVRVRADSLGTDANGVERAPALATQGETRTMGGGRKRGLTKSREASVMRSNWSIDTDAFSAGFARLQFAGHLGR